MYGMMTSERASRSWDLMYQKPSGLCGLSEMLFEEVQDKGLNVRSGCNKGLGISVSGMSDDILSANFVDIDILAEEPELRSSCLKTKDMLGLVETHKWHIHLSYERF